MVNEFQTLAEEIAYDYGKSLNPEFVRRVKYALIGFRAMIIRQDYAKSGNFSSNLIESFCTTLVQVKETECCSTGDSECKVWRTTIKIPHPVRTKNGSNYVYVGNANGTKPFTYLEPEDWPLIKKGTKFAKLMQYFAHYNNYIYLFNAGNTQKIRIRFVPDNPEDMLGLSCTENTCEQGVNIPEDMKRIMKMWMREELAGKPLSEGAQIKVDGTDQS